MNLIAEIAHSNLDQDVIARLSSAVSSLQNQLKNAELKIQALTLELAHHKRIRFGVKNETLSPAQRELFAEDWHSDHAELEIAVEALQPAPRAPRQRAGRQALPEHLPRIEHRHEPEHCDCAQCGTALTLVREEITEQLDVEPARFFVHRHIRPQYACRHCETMVAEPAPAAIIDGGLAAPGLLGWLLINKFQDHLPLYRLEQIAARSGVTLARSTLADWVGRCGVALQPLAQRLAELLRERSCLHADETPVQQLAPGHGKTRRAYLWAYRSNTLDDGPPIAVFEYHGSRRGEHVRDFLRDWRGHLMVDDYAGYKALFDHGVTELACWAHARRKFFDLHSANGNQTAAHALHRIGELYALDAEARDHTPEQRRLARCRAHEKLADFKHWLDDTRLRTADGSALAKALDYTLKRWPALTRYAQSGDLPIDNNPVENIIRPIAIGKKNWLFAGSERAGLRAAAIQTLLATANLNGIDPAAWLKDTLEKLPTWPHSRLDELLPIKQRS
jgi:transposase